MISCFNFPIVIAIKQPKAPELQHAYYFPLTVLSTLFTPNQLYMFCYTLYKEVKMGIIKVSDEIHTEVRRVSGVMSRSINAQAEFWLKMGRLAELNPDKTFRELINEALSEVNDG